jgi:SAM-dependent methyltransferase
VRLASDRNSRGAFWQRKADALDDAHARRNIDDAQWFDEMAAIFEAAYLAGDNPRAQSGFGGDEARWESARGPIADAIDRDGTFLDIGCASGHLLETLVGWTPHGIEPYGLDFAPALAELARQRLPQWADRIFVGDALTWEPPDPVRLCPHGARLPPGRATTKGRRAAARRRRRPWRPADPVRLRQPA